ncbi:MAG TPA: alanine--tRNA ligase [Planctomycetaceae bacterium]|nr:alanine--tRNA ligase [Planctomycetaceae bacterium]
MKTDDLRESFLAFFESKGCVRKGSDVLVPRGDPTVLFTPAGMNQFKNQFLGIGKLDFTRAVTCQKCLRTGDIDNVGNTAYHHTFFEMLGNFSFGDYFKKEAIHWAWEYLTSPKWLGLAGERLSVTVYLDDDEAYDIWHKEVKIPADRIRREGESENFWPASAPSQGPDGVCGPCSEIYYHAPGAKSSVEIWNLVFTQFNRVGNPPNNLRPLPKKNIDTGMGLERTSAVLQGVDSNFENDLLKPLCLAAAEAVGVKYDYASPQGRPVRRIADHVRAVTFCVHENVVPGNEKQGYVVRQLLRRALLEGYLLGRQEPFLHKIVPTVANVMRRGYPELAETIERVGLVIKAEEEYFLHTVDKGLRKLDRCIDTVRKEGQDIISGDDAFDLHQTDGFLVELTEAIAARNNLRVDRGRFRELMEKHRGISGSEAFADSVMKAGPLDVLRETAVTTEFLGYETTEAQGEVVGIVAEDRLVEALREVGHEKPVAIVLDRTPFYGEAGGQVGDTGVLESADCTFNVQDTQRHGGFIVHIGHLRRGQLKIGMKLTAKVDGARRAGIRRAHSATHLLHHALQKALGTHATQRGSKVEADWLRFDFTQPKAIPREQLTVIENEINARIAEGAPVTWEVMDLEQAKKSGATALFGEKYPDRVRVVTMGDFSRELCGGTHLSNTGQVGLCKIVGEESVAAGTRRITALTGEKALEKIRHDESMLVELAQLVKAPRVEDLPHRVATLVEEVRTLKQNLSKLNTQAAVGLVDELVAKAVDVGGVKIITHQLEAGDADLLRSHIDQLRRKISPLAVLLASGADGKVLLIAGLSKELVERGLSAVDWVKASAKAVGGGGGGRPDLAQAGGKHADKLPQALSDAVEYLRQKLGA